MTCTQVTDPHAGLRVKYTCMRGMSQTCNRTPRIQRLRPSFSAVHRSGRSRSLRRSPEPRSGLAHVRGNSHGELKSWLLCCRHCFLSRPLLGGNRSWGFSRRLIPPPPPNPLYPSRFVPEGTFSLLNRATGLKSIPAARQQTPATWPNTENPPSLARAAAKQELSQASGLEVPEEVVFRYPTADLIAGFLVDLDKRW